MESQRNDGSCVEEIRQREGCKHVRARHSNTEFARAGKRDVRHIREQIIPKAKSLAGFKTGYWLINRKTGNGLTVTFWESEAAERASQSDAAKVREQAQKALGLQVVSVEAYEVIGQA